MLPYSFSPDGRRLAYFETTTAVTNLDIWTLPLDTSDPDHPKPGKPELFLHTPFTNSHPAFSPDGHWLAYRSNESGTNEVYVRPFPGPGGKCRFRPVAVAFLSGRAMHGSCCTRHPTATS